LTEREQEQEQGRQREGDEVRWERRQTSSGVMLGLLLVAAGIGLLLDRTGALPAPWRVIVWPALLIGYGLARLAQPRAQGREGLFFVLAGTWWLAGVAGWISMTLTWPLLLVALGAALVLQAVTAGRGPRSTPAQGFHRHGAGAWILPVIVVGAVLTSGLDRQMLGRDERSSAPGAFRAVSIMSRRTMALPPAPVTGGEVVTIMGRNSIDLRQATIEPGSTITIDVFGLMGTGVITVPEGWIVDVRTASVMGRMTDLRADDWNGGAGGAADPSAGQLPPPRLVVRGTMIMGRLVVTS
jgi:hypothetical protein